MHKDFVEAGVATVSVVIPDVMRGWLEQRAADHTTGDVSEYIAELIRREWERQSALTELKALIEEGLASGQSSLSTGDLLLEARRRVHSSS